MVAQNMLELQAANTDVAPNNKPVVRAKNSNSSLD
jgi:hypothetical protein